jgi:hypothetical protein
MCILHLYFSDMTFVEFNLWLGLSYFSLLCLVSQNVESITNLIVIELCVVYGSRTEIFKSTLVSTMNSQHSVRHCVCLVLAIRGVVSFHDVCAYVNFHCHGLCATIVLRASIAPGQPYMHLGSSCTFFSFLQFSHIYSYSVRWL